MTATPFDTIAFPLKDGAGILSVVAGIIDNVTIAPAEPAHPGTANGKRHYPVLNTKLLKARQQDNGGEDERADGKDGAPPSVTCASHESCIATYAGNAFCYDTILSTFHDTLGTTGSAATGDYELADGQKGNYFDGPHPTVVSPVVKGNSTGTAAASGTGTTRVVASPTVGPGSSDGASGEAPVDRTGGCGRIGAALGTVLGAVGVVAALGNLVL